MQEKFTPGPWQADGESVESVDGTYVADCTILFASIDRTVENEANARLIAAAPELLEACKSALLTFVDEAVGEERRVKCRAAIAKAEGSTP